MNPTTGPFRMSGDDRRDPERELLRNLYDELQRATEREERLVSRIEEFIGIAKEVRRNQADIKEIHRDLYGPGGLISKVDMVEKLPVFGANDDGGTSGIFLSTPTVVSIAVFVVGAALTGLWHIIDWIIRLARSSGT